MDWQVGANWFYLVMIDYDCLWLICLECFRMFHNVPLVPRESATALRRLALPFGTGREESTVPRLWRSFVNTGGFEDLECFLNMLETFWRCLKHFVFSFNLSIFQTCLNMGKKWKECDDWIWLICDDTRCQVLSSPVMWHACLLRCALLYVSWPEIVSHLLLWAVSRIAVSDGLGRKCQPNLVEGFGHFWNIKYKWD